MVVERGSELLRSLRDLGPSTRTQLAEALGTSRSTINAELAALVERGFVQDAPAAVSSGGRPSAQVQLHEGLRVVAVSIGETRARVAVVHAGLTILQGYSLAVGGRTTGEIAGWVRQSVARLLVEDASNPGLPGAASPALGLTMIAGFLDEDDVARILEAPGITRSARLAPARAMALGEGHAGACQDDTDYVVVRLGAGITCTTVSGGRVVDGVSSGGGEVGHFRVDEFGPACTCGNSGCLDSFAGIPALLAQAQVAGEAGRSAAFAELLQQGRALEVADLVAAVNGGDRVAVQIARDAGRRVGEMVAALVAFADPGRVVLGGPAAALGDNLLAEVRASVYRKAPASLTHDLGIELSGLGERAVLIGAAHAATEDLFRR